MLASHFPPVAATAIEFRCTHPEAPAIAVLDECFGSPIHGPILFDRRLAHPASNFGGLIAAAFDPEMTPHEWVDWAGEGSDQALRDALMQVWTAEVLPRFERRYGISIV